MRNELTTAVMPKGPREKASRTAGRYNDPLVPYLTGEATRTPRMYAQGDLGESWWNPVGWIKGAARGVSKVAKPVVKWATSGGMQKTGEKMTEVGYSFTPQGRESLRAGYEMGKFTEALTKYWPIWLGVLLLGGGAVWMMTKGKK